MVDAVGLFKLGRRLLAGEAEPAPPGPERRASRRVALGLPVQVCVGGGKFRPSRVVDANLRGVAVQADEAGIGESIAISFPGIPKVLPAFNLTGRVTRVVDGSDPLVGVRIDRAGSSAEALAQYRNYVVYYLRHKPLLEEISSGYFEGRCVTCDWVGRVGRRNPTCSNCGGEVERLDA